MIVATLPAPTVLPPSRIRLGELCLTDGVFSEFSVIIFSESIDFLCSFKIFVAKDVYKLRSKLRSNCAHFFERSFHFQTQIPYNSLLMYNTLFNFSICSSFRCGVIASGTFSNIFSIMMISSFSLIVSKQKE